MESIGRTQVSLGATNASIQAVTTGLRTATAEAQEYNRVLSEPAKIQNAGGVENVTASIKQARGELNGLMQQYQELAKAGKLDYGEGTTANLAKAQTAITQQVAALKTLETEAKAAGKAGILGDGGTCGWADKPDHAHHAVVDAGAKGH